MDLEKMFEMQDVLDNHIYDRFPEHKGQYNLDWKLLALLSELGELANEHRGFKKWSKDQEPRTKIYTWINGLGQPMESVNDPRMLIENHQLNAFRIKNPLLEEYVDCVHFFISIAIELGIKPSDFVVTCDYTQPTVTLTFNRVFSTLSSIDVLMDPETPASISHADIQETLHEAFSCFVGLGEKFLGFTWDQVEQAYISKNEINHERQANGY